MKIDHRNQILSRFEMAEDVTDFVKTATVVIKSNQDSADTEPES
jgi:hypothetical protein